MAVESTGTNEAAAVCLAAGAKLQADTGSDKESTQSYHNMSDIPSIKYWKQACQIALSAWISDGVTTMQYLSGKATHAQAIRKEELHCKPITQVTEGP